MRRLTVRNFENKACCAVGGCDAYEDCYECPGFQDILAKLDHYEELEEAGRLVELPCKVGDTVREVDKPLGIIAEWRVTEFVIHEDVVFAENPYLGEYCDIKEFGKTVFLTCEEAEAALKGAE